MQELLSGQWTAGDVAAVDDAEGKEKLVFTKTTGVIKLLAKKRQWRSLIRWTSAWDRILAATG